MLASRAGRSEVCYACQGSRCVFVFIMDLQTNGPTLAASLMARATGLQQGNQRTTGSLKPSFLLAAQASLERVVRLG